MNKVHSILLGLTLMFLVACSGSVQDNGMTTYTIGSVFPLTEDGAVYGLPIQRVVDRAVADVNAKWLTEGKDMQIKIIYEDGKCNGKDALTGAQKLVNFDGVNVMFAAACSSELLGIASFTEENEILVLSPTASSPDVTTAGDFIFRTYPSDVAQVSAGFEYILSEEFESLAILSENTDYAQALREGYLRYAQENGLNIVADEIVGSEVRDVRTEITKITATSPDVLVVLPQTIPMGIIFLQQLYQSGNELPLLMNEVAGLPDTLESARQEAEGATYPEPYFANADSPYVREVLEQTDCDLGLYCATTYDGIILLAEKMELCGDDPVCLRDTFYATQGWEGAFVGELSFDENGDVGGSFVLKRIVDGEPVALE